MDAALQLLKSDLNELILSGDIFAYNKSKLIELLKNKYGIDKDVVEKEVNTAFEAAKKDLENKVKEFFTKIRTEALDEILSFGWFNNREMIDLIYIYDMYFSNSLNMTPAQKVRADAFFKSRFWQILFHKDTKIKIIKLKEGISDRLLIENEKFDECPIEIEIKIGKVKVYNFIATEIKLQIPDVLLKLFVIVLFKYSEFLKQFGVTVQIHNEEESFADILIEQLKKVIKSKLSSLQFSGSDKETIVVKIDNLNLKEEIANGNFNNLEKHYDEIKLCIPIKLLRQISQKHFGLKYLKKMMEFIKKRIKEWDYKIESYKFLITDVNTRVSVRYCIIPAKLLFRASEFRDWLKVSGAITLKLTEYYEEQNIESEILNLNFSEHDN